MMFEIFMTLTFYFIRFISSFCLLKNSFLICISLNQDLVFLFFFFVFFFSTECHLLKVDILNEEMCNNHHITANMHN